MLGLGIRRRLRRILAPEPVTASATSAPPDERLVHPKSPFECTEFETERWNKEWLHYLGREWRVQLTSHTEYPDTPPLPREPADMIDLNLGFGPSLRLWCPGDALENKRVLELGCGCGNFGKLIGRYVDQYVGLDFSELALRVARLVSPANCQYIHVADRKTLEPYFETIDTVVGRFFWIHQNRELAGHNLDYLRHFLKPDGRLFADFYWPDPDQKQFTVLRPHEPLNAKPSVVFLYQREEIEELATAHGFRIVNEEIHRPLQRRFVELQLQS